MREKGHIPIRMCIGCRKKRNKMEMVRFIQGSNGVVFIDEKKVLKGRGFYLCPNLLCLRMAQRKKRVGQILGMDKLSMSSGKRLFHGINGSI